MKQKIILLSIVLLVIGNLMNSQSIMHPWNVIDRGGGRSTTPGNFTLLTSIGQPAIGVMTTPSNFTLEAGYLPQVREVISGGNGAFSMIIAEGWNMISVPVITDDWHVNVLFPAATSKAFAYETGYQKIDILAPCVGYWLKFPAGQITYLSGTQFTSDTITVVKGWNMIGALSVPFPVNSITSNPPGLVTSSFYAYSPVSGYFPSNTLEPEMGYWVRATEDGSLFLNSDISSSALAKQRIQIVASTERPPSPPSAENGDEAPKLPKVYGLSQNYPNPFNPSTMLEYQLPEESRVSVRIYNILGEVVVSLVNQTEQAGYKSVNWNASSLASGIYFYRLEATSVANPRKTFTSVKKMVLMK